MKIISESWDMHTNQPQTKQQIAYQTLKAAIISLELPSNTILMEKPLMEQFELGRTPMREALRRLDSEGFVSNIPNKGFMVNDIQYKDFRELYEIKEALESEASYLCCFYKNSDSIEKINTAFHNYKIALEKQDYKKVILLDLDFHWSIVEGSQNQMLKKQMHVIMDQTLKFLNIYYSDSFHHLIIPSLCKQHESIIEAIKGDNPDLARKSMLEHIQLVKTLNRDMLFS